VVLGLLRASFTVTVLVVLYFTLPMTGSLDGSAAILLTVGLLAFAAVVAWQVRAVLRSRHPGLRAVEALAAAIPLFLLVFAAAYVQIADADAGSHSEPLDRTGALYFTVTVFSTVGFVVGSVIDGVPESQSSASRSGPVPRSVSALSPRSSSRMFRKQLRPRLTSRPPDGIRPRSASSGCSWSSPAESRPHSTSSRPT
jgi:4-amino-4-deoxy-L-arabinose transferase-like glycosyltransferase